MVRFVSLQFFLYCKWNTFYLWGKILPGTDDIKMRQAMRKKIRLCRLGKNRFCTQAREKGAQWFTDSNTIRVKNFRNLLQTKYLWGDMEIYNDAFITCSICTAAPRIFVHHEEWFCVTLGNRFFSEVSSSNENLAITKQLFSFTSVNTYHRGFCQKNASFQ